MRLSLSQTPSNTPSNTPTNTNSETPCPTNTPTNTPTINITPSTTATQTNTPTQTITPSSTPLCENNFTLTQTEGIPVNIQQGLYNRISSYTGGSFNYGFFSGSPQQFFTGTAPNGRNYLVYERQVGGFWTDIGFYYGAVGTPPSVNVWRGITTTGSSIVNGAPFASISGNVVLASASTVYNGAYIPPFSSSIAGRSWNFAYDAICPTNTPTLSPTQTQTSTPTSTIGLTPTQTPSNTTTQTPSQTQTQTNTGTLTNTPTTTSTPTRTPEITPSMTQTNTPTPSITPTNATAIIDITNGSLDIQITAVYVNGVNTSVIGGVLPNTTGNGTTLSTNQLGTYTVDVYYSTLITGQKITLTDSDLFSTCINTSFGSNIASFTSVVVADYHNVNIDAQDGTC